MSDRRRILATLSFADTDAARRLLNALTELRNAIEELPPTAAVDLPSLDELELETATLPRDAFFGDTQMVPISEAAGRIASEQITPHPRASQR
jgi:lysine decarboxylase